jgi:hypothetical protein
VLPAPMPRAISDTVVEEPGRMPPQFVLAPPRGQAEAPRCHFSGLLQKDYLIRVPDGRLSNVTQQLDLVKLTGVPFGWIKVVSRFASRRHGSIWFWTEKLFVFAEIDGHLLTARCAIHRRRYRSGWKNLPAVRIRYRYRRGHIMRCILPTTLDGSAVGHQP